MLGSFQDVFEFDTQTLQRDGPGQCDRRLMFAVVFSTDKQSACSQHKPDDQVSGNLVQGSAQPALPVTHLQRSIPGNIWVTSEPFEESDQRTTSRRRMFVCQPFRALAGPDRVSRGASSARLAARAVACPGLSHHEETDPCGALGNGRRSHRTSSGRFDDEGRKRFVSFSVLVELLVRVVVEQRVEVVPVRKVNVCTSFVQVVGAH